MATSTTVTKPILPKIAPHPGPVIFLPINISLANGLCNNGRGQISLIARTIPPAPPPLPPPSLLKQPRRRIPILIDQKSIKKNLQLNKQTLQTKLASRPEPTQLFERGILRSEEEKLRRFQHRENIRSHIEKRPTRETLVTQGILLSDACVDPLIRVRGQLLKRNKLVDNLNNKLRKRPGPLELVNRKILQVDAELEQAVQEGRLPFTPTLLSPSSTFGETTITTTEMISTIIPPPQIRHDEQQYSSSSTSSSTNTNSVSLSSTVGPKAKIRKKSQQLHRTPYDNTSITTNKIIKLKSIANSKRSTNESIGSLETSSTSSNLSTDFSNSNGISPMETDDIHSDSMQSETNYEINLKQQQIYLQWQEDHRHDPNAITPAMSSTTSNCSTPLQSNDTPSIHSTRSSFSVSSAHSGNNGNTRFSSLYSPSVSPTHANETTTLQIPIIESEKPKSKLADFKVQDLKNECKKRQLPVSGAKPQLLERLKPYEEIILATLTPSNGTIQSKSTNSGTSGECNEVTSTSAGTCQNSCGHQQQQQQTIYCQTKPSLPAQDVITDYLQQQCQPQQSQQKPLVLQLPPNSKPPQLVQVLVDSNGTVVGVAAMPQQTISPTKSSVPCCCVQCKKQPGSHISTIAENIVQSKSHESKPIEPTFSFSQMGSGGQFTLANSSPIVSECRQMAQNCAGCIAAASQSAIKIVSSELATTPNSSRPIVATVQASSNTSHSLCTAPPLIRSHTSSTMSSSSTTKKPHIALQKSESNSSTVEQTVAAVAHRRHSIPASVFSHNEDLSDKILSPDQICEIPSPNAPILSAQDDENDTNLDEIDPNVLMTAKTFSQHEENLRIQQRLIEDLQAELAKSQEQLRREQKLIIAAKRLQLRTDQQTGKQCTQAEILLNNLDIKQINKHHIQHFIQHKSQQQSVQSQTSDYQQLLQVEQKLQEELHMEQAVQDIVRLIKQDGRTALLIVQLLRRYQLERNHQLQQAAAAAQQQKQTGDKASQQRTTATSTSSGQNELTPGSIQQQQQECSGRTSVMSSKSIPNESSNCCQQHSLQPQNIENCCANRACLNQQKSAQIVVIDDSPASSPAPPIINAPTVGETLQKQKETTGRSKSQNPRTNKRKNNGSRSIWAKTNVIEKSASFTNANTTTSGTPSKVVDMEEIFRTVINDTSDLRDTSLLTTTTENNSHPQKSQPLQQQQIITNMDASSELVPQLNGFHLVANSDDSSNSAIADDHMDHTSSYQQQVLNSSNGYPQEYIIPQQPMQTEICSTTAIFIQPENISSCHVDCYSKPRNENSPERVEIIGNGHEYIQATNIQQFEYAKNEDFDDLMDVLRDDQECINGHMQEDGNCGREILGYTSAELATFLAADENIVNNGNIIYETFSQTQGQEHYPLQNYQQHCVQQLQQQQQNNSNNNNTVYEHQGNIEYEITAGNLGHHSTLHIEPHQEQAIDDILNNSDMMEPSVEWFDNYFQSPITERQMTACGNRPSNGANIHRPMDTFV